MGLLAQYGSDSGSDDGNEQHPQQAPVASSSSKPPAAVPKPKKPVKIGFHHPLLGKGQGDSDDDDEDDGRPSKRVKIDDKKPQPKNGSLPKGKGSSALLSMLPPPTRALPKSKVEPKPEEDGNSKEQREEKPASLMPRAVKSKAKVAAAAASKPPAELDLFGVASASTERAAAPSSAISSAPPSLSITSAPDAPDYVPPPPSIEDPYPGYYQLPSGQWAAYDPEYYMSFFKAASNKERVRGMAEQGAAGHGWNDVTELGEGDVANYDVKNDMDKARLEIEASKNKTPAKAYIETNYRVVGRTTGIASQRHQLSSLLRDAHVNRSELEERIATNKRNKRESGQQYGF